MVRVLGNVVVILIAIVVGVVRLTVVEHWVVRFTVVGGDVVVLAIVVVDWFVVVRIVAVLWLVVGDVSEVMMLVLNIVLVVGGVNWQVLVVNLLTRARRCLFCLHFDFWNFCSLGIHLGIHL